MYLNTLFIQNALILIFISHIYQLAMTGCLDYITFWKYLCKCPFVFHYTIIYTIKLHIDSNIILKIQKELILITCYVLSGNIFSYNLPIGTVKIRSNFVGF